MGVDCDSGGMLALLEEVEHGSLLPGRGRQQQSVVGVELRDGSLGHFDLSYFLFLLHDEGSPSKQVGLLLVVLLR